jgi:hypothetical protein
MKIVICGDSFSAGVGLHNAEEIFGHQLAKHFPDSKVIVLAKGGASNYATHLQAEFAIKELRPDLLVMSTTSFDRIDFMQNNIEDQFLTARDINYHGYSPYGPHEWGTHHFENDPFYKPKLLTEGLNGLDYYLRNMNGHGKDDWFKRLHTERPRRLQLILDYHAQIGSEFIRRDQDISVIFKAYSKAQLAGIETLIISDNDQLIELVPRWDLINENWFSLAQKWPDDFDTGHTSKEGHKYISDLILKRISFNEKD